jgi:hypothetical protein
MVKRQVFTGELAKTHKKIHDDHRKSAGNQKEAEAALRKYKNTIRELLTKRPNLNLTVEKSLHDSQLKH